MSVLSALSLGLSLIGGAAADDASRITVNTQTHGFLDGIGRVRNTFQLMGINVTYTS